MTKKVIVTLGGKVLKEPHNSTNAGKYQKFVNFVKLFT